MTFILLTDHLYELNGRVAKILVRLKDQARGAEALADLASYEETCLTLYATLPHKMAEAMEAAGLYQWKRCVRSLLVRDPSRAEQLVRVLGERTQPRVE
jgi:hypothetical protein